jgi:Dehydrogenases with different specificities (related to short-chain alcohol dehydrogenases)
MKCALVTGGSRGIGRAISIKLASLGYHILINFRSNFAEAEQTLSSIRLNKGKGELLPFDVGNKEDIASKLGLWMETNKEDHIEVLVNNAGIKDDVLMMWMKDEQWENVMRTNLDSFFYTTRLVLNDMLMKRYGRIINIVSLSGLRGLPGQTNYSAAKGGVIAATKALAQEVGRRGITVNAVAPGFIKTDMTENISEKEMKALIPVNRFGTSEEVAHLVAFLVSPESGYITGEVISINGGMYS